MELSGIEQNPRSGSCGRELSLRDLRYSSRRCPIERERSGRDELMPYFSSEGWGGWGGEGKGENTSDAISNNPFRVIQKNNFIYSTTLRAKVVRLIRFTANACISNRVFDVTFNMWISLLSSVASEQQ